MENKPKSSLLKELRENIIKYGKTRILSGESTDGEKKTGKKNSGKLPHKTPASVCKDLLCPFWLKTSSELQLLARFSETHQCHQVETSPTLSLLLSASWIFFQVLSSPCWWDPTSYP